MDPPETSMTPPPGLVEPILDSHARDEVSPLPGVESVYSEASTPRKGRTGRSRCRKRSSTNPTGFIPISADQTATPTSEAAPVPSRAPVVSPFTSGFLRGTGSLRPTFPIGDPITQL